MSQNRPSAFSSLRMGGEDPGDPAIDPNSQLTSSTEVIREKVQDGLTGETKEMQYTQCKIVGNGSFGVVFQTKLSPSGEDAAIKRVLQDKRFKVRSTRSDGLSRTALMLVGVESRAADHAHRAAPEHRRAQGLLLFQWRTCTSSLPSSPDIELTLCRRMKSISTSSSNSCPKRSTVPHAISTR